MEESNTTEASGAKPNRTNQAWEFWRGARAGARNDGQRPSVLVVDDDPSTGSVYIKRLQDEGYQTTRAGDPTVALSLAQQARPGMIFVHMGRGGSGSSAFIRALRSNDATRHIPVTLLTSYFNRELEGLGLTPVAQHLV
jgi:CheY-like chemotaxis protein